MRGTAADPDPGLFAGTGDDADRPIQVNVDLTVVHGDQYNANRDLQVHLTEQPLPPSPHQVRSSLPRDVLTFTGRTEQLDAITAMANRAAAGGVVTIQGGVQAIDGMPGVGKTALAVHVAHRVKDRFPDRQLFIDMLAHTPGQAPVTPHEALGGLLAAVGMDSRYLPADLQERIGHWRDRMTGQKALLILDNVLDSRQVSALLPGDPQCLVLITSRRYLGDLDAGAQPITLNPLPEDEARTLFLRLAPRAATDPDAAVAVHEIIVDLAGGLPLAISLLARMYANHPRWSLRALIEQTRHRLLTARAENTTITAVFNLSYQTLTPPQQRLFVLLGLHPGVEIEGHAAAALGAISHDEAADLLADLYSARLLTEPSGEHPGRYGMHDLVRAYIRDRAVSTLPAPDRDQAQDRLLDHYQHTATLADTYLARYTRPAAAEPPATSPLTAQALPDQIRAVAWARLERGNLLACLEHVTAAHQHARIVALTAALAGLLRQDGPWTDAVTRHTTAADAAHRVGDRLGQANALHELGVVRWLTDDYSAAAEVLRQALTLYQQVGDRLGQANALHGLGVVRWLTGDFLGAADLLEEALALYQLVDDQLGLGSALSYLGFVRRLTGDYPAAGSLLEQALALYQQLGDLRGQAYALRDLGAVRRSIGDFPAAVDLLEQGLALYQQIGDRLGQANTLNYLGAVRLATGDYPAAARLLEQAQALCLELGDRSGEVEVLNQLGTLCRLRGDLEDAQAHHHRSLENSHEIGSAWDEAHALAGLARCDLARGRTDQGRTRLTAALELFRRMGAVEAVGLTAELDALTVNPETGDRSPAVRRCG